MTVRLRSLLALVAVATLVACGSDDSGGGGGADATEDTGGGDVTREDVDLDLGGGTDTTPDTPGEDTTPDVAPDVTPDVEPDVVEDTGGTDAGGGDTGGTDTGGTDTGGTDAGDAGGDVEADVPRPEGCGNGVIDGDEECDDGNDVNTDACTNDCRESRCGDGIVNSTIGALEIESPLVVNPNGVEGFVCDDGGSCPEASCDLSEDDGFAVEHGICQALGHNRALAVAWGGGAGAGSSPMLHAYNWTCFDFVCSASDDDGTASDCQAWEMLNTITCEGVVGEECDNGGDNADAPDACRTSCLLPFCGDGIVDSGEECDDANRVNNDGCSNNCLLPQCGDGVVQAGEACDDANDNDLDACRNDCTEPFCGDGIVSLFETEVEFSSPIVTNPFGAEGHVCDDGGTCQGSSCDVSMNPTAPEHGICEALGFDYALSVSYGGGAGDSDPVMPHAYNWACVDFDCGPGTNDFSADNCGAGEMLNTILCFGGVDEECDAGDANSLEPDAACRPDCRVPYCGDGVTDTGEECDDGNRVPDDGCSNTCRLPACGDAVIQEGEECDDGDANSDTEADACRTTCLFASCGDGGLDTGEECDDGNDVPDDGCSDICRTPGCGDNVVQPGEECDDGNEINDDLCSNACTLPVCGDEIVQGDEDCDDGNLIDDDACRNNCQAPSCGDGVLQQLTDAGGACSLAIVVDGGFGDTAELVAMLDAEGFVAEVFDNSDTSFSSDAAFLRGYSLVLFLSNNRAISEGEATALNEYVEGGGRLIITGYDTLGSPSDPLLAGVARLTTTGDGPFEGGVTVTAAHPVFAGPYGSFPVGTTWTATSTDHDGAQVTDESIQLMSIGLATKLSWAEGVGGSGIVAYWNGNAGARDWTAEDTGRAIFLNLMDATCGYYEDCDEGEFNSDTPDATCRTDCTFPRCGDGVADTGEECDDGNDANNDECNPDCTFTFCGDGVAQAILGEECDDGADNDDFAADACRTDCLAAYCGDGVLDSGEDCDDGNRIEDDGCSNTCELPGCGDGVIQPGEECDDGNEIDTDTCLTTCRNASCGDGIRQDVLGEECDDGNASDDDTCTTECLFGPTYVPCGDETITGAGVYSGNTAGAGNDFTDYSSEDYAYGFTAVVDGTMTASLCGGATWDTRLVAYDATTECPGTQLIQNDDACGLQSEITFDVTAGNTYVVVVEAFSGGSGAYTLTITGP